LLSDIHYLCGMKQSLKENGGLPASILWTLAIVAGGSGGKIFYIQTWSRSLGSQHLLYPTAAKYDTP